MGRRPCCEKVGLKKGRWTAEEDERLTKYIQTNGEGSWRSLPKNAGLLRCGKSCRLRWINYLRSDLKRGNITSEEEDVIIKLHASLGNRWSLIANHLEGRTDNEIKNYWNSHLRRRIHTFWRRNNDEANPVIMDVAKLNLPPRRKGRCKRNTQRSPLKTTTVTEEVEQTRDHIPLPPTPNPKLDKQTSMALESPTERTNEENEESTNLEEVLSNIDICDDESLDLEWFFSQANWEGNKNEDTNVREESQNGGSTDEANNLMNSLSYDSPWEWESVVRGQEIWKDETMNLEWLLNNEEWEDQNNEGDACGREKTDNTDEVQTGNFTHCNSSNFESVFQHLWSDDTEIEQTQGFAERDDVIITWLLS